MTSKHFSLKVCRDPELQFVLNYTSESRVGAILSQCSPLDQKSHPCDFFSSHLFQAKKNDDVSNWELLAVVLALQELRHWLEGTTHTFIIWTDYKNLPGSIIIRLAGSMFLGLLNFTLTYCPGSRNIKPDAFSQQFTPFVQEDFVIIPHQPVPEGCLPGCLPGPQCPGGDICQRLPAIQVLNEPLISCSSNSVGHLQHDF